MRRVAHLASAMAATGLTAAGIAGLVLALPVLPFAAEGHDVARIVAADAQGRPILLARMVVTASSLPR